MKSMRTVGETRGNGGGVGGDKGMCPDKDATFGTGEAKESLGKRWEERGPGISWARVWARAGMAFPGHSWSFWCGQV